MEAVAVLNVLFLRINEPFLAALAAAALAQLIKVVAALPRGRRAIREALFMAGGMPSAHSALAVGLWASVVLEQGWSSPMTGVAGGLAVFILYDAAVIRRALEQQAVVINRLLEEVCPGELEALRLPRSLGHTRVEVLAGSLLGVIVAYLLTWLGRYFLA